MEQPAVDLPPIKLHSVRCGCWLLSGIAPPASALVAYDGTLRVECHSDGRTASGDLYQRAGISSRRSPSCRSRRADRRPAAGPNPADGIPILPRRATATTCASRAPENFYFGNGFTLGFELWRFTAPNSWALEGALTAQMTRMAAPAGYPSASDYAGRRRQERRRHGGRPPDDGLAVDVLPQVHGRDRHRGRLERPLDSGAGHTWKTVMDEVGWDVTVQLSDTNVAEPSGESWSDAEMHAAMLARRAAANLDTEWRYHVLAVKNIDSTPRGIMYDAGGTDSNNVPREGVGISSHWMIDPTAGARSAGSGSAPRRRRISAPPCTRSATRWGCTTTSPITASCAPAT